MSACKKCDGGTCRECKTLARQLRRALRRGIAQPKFAALLMATGQERTEPTDRSPDGRVVAGGLPDADAPASERAATQALLFRMANAVKHAG